MTRSDKDYLYGLDVVRFLAAVSVAAFHLSWQTPTAAWMVPFGWVGVQVFFVISGLVIANSAFGSSARDFTIGRFLRLYPAAWCCALITFTVLRIAPAATYTSAKIGVDSTFQALFGSMVLVGTKSLASAYWTLPIEISFYLLVAILLWLKRFENVRLWSFLLILWSIPYLIFLVVQTLGFIHFSILNFGYSGRNRTLLRHGCYFGLGMLIWLTQKRRIGRWEQVLMGLALVAATGEIYARAADVSAVTGRTAVDFGVRMTTLPLTIAACTAFLLACGAIIYSARFADRFPASPLLRKVVRTLGLTTYPFYLLHEAVGGYSMRILSSSGLSAPFQVLGALVVVGVAAALVATVAEPAIRNALRRVGLNPRRTAKHVNPPALTIEQTQPANAD